MFGHWTLSSCSHELKMIRGKTSWLGSGLPLFKLTSPHYTQTVTHNNTPPPNIMVTQTNAYKINICNTITQYIRMICYVSLIQRTYNINVTYMLDAETDLRYQTGHWPVLHGCTTWDHVLFVLDGWNWPSCAIALTSATSIQSTCYICCLRACASYICCIAARATYICCISARATCTRCLDWPVRSHWPTHPVQEVWLTGEQIRSRLSTSPNLTQAVLSARVKAARKQQQQKKKQFFLLLLFVIDHQSHVPPTTYWTNTINPTFGLGHDIHRIPYNPKSTT